MQFSRLTQHTVTGLVVGCTMYNVCTRSIPDRSRPRLMTFPTIPDRSLKFLFPFPTVPAGIPRLPRSTAGMSLSTSDIHGLSAAISYRYHVELSNAVLLHGKWEGY